MIIYDKKLKCWIGHKISFIMAKGKTYEQASTKDNWKLCIVRDESGYHVPIVGTIIEIDELPLKERSSLSLAFYTKVLNIVPLALSGLAFLFYYFMVEDSPANLIAAITGFMAVYLYIDCMVQK